MNTVALGHKISQASPEMKYPYFLGLSFAIQLTTLCRGTQQVALGRLLWLNRVDETDCEEELDDSSRTWLGLLQRETIVDQVESVTTFSASTTLVSFRRRLTSSHGEIIFCWESDKKKNSLKSLVMEIGR